MPKRRTLRSLERLSLENVAKNIRRIWAKACAEDHLDRHSLRSVAEPYIALPDSLVQQLFMLLEEGNCLVRPVLRFLLVPQLTALNLQSCPRLVIKAIADIIAVRCKNLSSLDIKGCSRVPADSLIDLIKALPRLTKLNLSETQCNARVLAAVGSHCHQLLKLDICNCSRLSLECLLHLAYDPATGSLGCPALQVLIAGNPMRRPHLHYVFRPLVFLLLALPSLTFLEHAFVVEAVSAIYWQQFDNAQVAPEFPSLQELARRRMSANSGSRHTLALTQLNDVPMDYLPIVFTTCPRLADVTMLLGSEPGFGQAFASWHYISRLTLNCSGSCAWDVANLLPMTAALGLQLRSLTLSSFYCDNALSFWTLLGHCLNLREFSGALLPPEEGASDEEETSEAFEANFSPTPHEFPYLQNIFFMYCNVDSPLPSQHEAVLTACLASLLRHSPMLERLILGCLPFSLDGVFEQVLEPPGTALAHLQKLSLLDAEVSRSTVHLLLSSENQLSLIDLGGCPDICWADYEDFCRRVRSEGLELEIYWR